MQVAHEPSEARTLGSKMGYSGLELGCGEFRVAGSRVWGWCLFGGHWGPPAHCTNFAVGLEQQTRMSYAPLISLAGFWVGGWPCRAFSAIWRLSAGGLFCLESAVGVSWSRAALQSGSSESRPPEACPQTAELTKVALRMSPRSLGVFDSPIGSLGVPGVDVRFFLLCPVE